MIVRNRVGLAALVASLALTVTACGGGSKPEADKAIPGVDSGSASASASPSPSAPSGADRPKISLPADDVLVFEGENSGDPKMDAVLRDNAEHVRAVDDAIARKDPKSQAVAFYTKDTALVDATNWINGFIKDGKTVTGTVRYFSRKVTFLKDGAAALTYCADETKGYTKDLKTGKVDVTPVTKNSYVFYNERLEQNDKGVWQTTKTISERGFQACQP
ncbi:hypothetical protein ACIPYQ_05590 [Streptomyces sp. NPDC090045]|uniref:hypothetical protein n=1 Tax=Streptomyces sp. NPDC090045 TaxID=3365927 RepID=UPI00381D8F8C